MRKNAPINIDKAILTLNRGSAIMMAIETRTAMNPKVAFITFAIPLEYLMIAQECKNKKIIEVCQKGWDAFLQYL